jgi:hypothetical protein
MRQTKFYTYRKMYEVKTGIKQQDPRFTFCSKHLRCEEVDKSQLQLHVKQDSYSADTNEIQAVHFRR